MRGARLVAYTLLLTRLFFHVYIRKTGREHNIDLPLSFYIIPSINILFCLYEIEEIVVFKIVSLGLITAMVIIMTIVLIPNLKDIKR